MKISVFWGKLKLPFRWLFAKRWRWIPVAVILAALIILVITVYSVKLYNHIIWQIEENEYQEQIQKDEEAIAERLKTNLPISQQEWVSSNISSYVLDLEVYVGGHSIWEEVSHGHSSPGKLVASLRFQVNDNKITDIKRIIQGLIRPFSFENIYFKSISNLFVIIQEALDGKVNEDVIAILRDSYPDTVFDQPLSTPPPESIVPLRVYAEFGYYYGQPEYISIYYTVGDHDNHVTNSIIIYRISNFTPL